MRRSLSLVLALIVAVSSAATTSPHVHAYDGHDHPEHQHGPASHGHDHHHGSPAAATHSHQDAHEDEAEASVRIEACDAGDHVIRLPGATAPLPHADIQLAVLASPIVVAPPSPGRLAIAPLDVRVHGPPSDTHLPARAPPLTPLA